VVVKRNGNEGRMADMKTYYTAKVLKLRERKNARKMYLMKQSINSRSWTLCLHNTCT
jgi:hypothetical protein